MRLPNAEKAVVDEAKVRGYLLAPEHPVGRFKAAFFRSLGYTTADWQRLQDALLSHAQTGDASPEPSSTYGQKFRIRAMLQGLAGRSAVIVSIWIIRPGDDQPRFVTAFPGESP